MNYMNNEFTIKTIEETIMKLNKVPTEIIHFTCASCGKENDTPYIFFSLYKGRTICENCYNQERKLAMRMLLGAKRDEWAYYRYCCTGNKKWMVDKYEID